MPNDRIHFDIAQYSFVLDTVDGLLTCTQTANHKYLKDSTVGRALETLIVASPDVVTNETLFEVTGITSSMDNCVWQAGVLIKDLMADKTLDVKNPIKTVRGYGRAFSPKTPTRLVRDPVLQAGIDNDILAKASYDEAEGYARIVDLIDSLVRLYPDELDGFFEVSELGARLPFHVMSKATTAAFNLPIPISDDLLPPPDRGAESLKTRRIAQGKLVYPGQIYRLVKATQDGWELARTVYTQLIDDCDYLKAKILEGWGALKDASVDERDTFLLTSDVVKEWLSRVDGIRRGDFSSYHAGMAFSIPIFQRLPDNRLRMLLARGSDKKQADAKKLHCCPAGMLEFAEGWVTRLNDLTAQDFATYCMKEMLEETLRADAFKFANKINFLEGVGHDGDPMAADELRGYCDKIILEVKHEIASGKLVVKLPNGEERPLSIAAVDEADKIADTINDRQIYTIVDAFVLRPEIIVPIFVDEQVDFFLSWEHEHAETEDFASLADTEQRLPAKFADWAAPGFAAAYLTTKDWFSKS